MPPKVRTPRFRARPSREITSPCFSRLIVLSALSYPFPDFIVLKVRRDVYDVVFCFASSRRCRCRSVYTRFLTDASWDRELARQNSRQKAATYYQ